MRWARAAQQTVPLRHEPRCSTTSTSAAISRRSTSANCGRPTSGWAPNLTSRTSGRIVEPVSIPLRPFRGVMDWPVAGRLSGRFGVAGTTGSVLNGIEVTSAINTPVRAVHDGLVDYAEGFTGLGTLVILDHGANTYSLYGYLAEALVKRGDMVRAGAEVGRVGLAPVGGQPTLYFELRVDGSLVDPIQWLKPR